ncbi:MAG: UDP-N-acetylmuramoyl-L-alanyl-D-glutamate--2,6-diaminopimelate ligase [Dehalococcoidia bacterium]|nr:UDP-N-acetylmuramoyl-L-alanyl-D-glutamate--2,6-diaminopimelate ligase [Dehalococcoidia bacterium]
MSNNNWINRLSQGKPAGQRLLESLKDFPKEITGIAFDSRLVQPGNIFVCLQGTQVNSNKYIHQAENNGAALIVSDDTELLDEGYFSNPFASDRVPAIYTRKARTALSYLSWAFYDKSSFRADPFHIGITGTDGKSSTAYIIYTALRELGVNAALISTLGVFIDGKEIIDEDQKIRLTTPDPPELFQLIAQAKKSDSDVIILEITSHALQFDKVNPIDLDCAIFTSFSPDHQEFHEDEDDYFNAKTKIINLIRRYDSSASGKLSYRKTGHLILNADNEKIAKLRSLVHNASTIGFNTAADVPIAKIEESLFQTRYQIGSYEFDEKGLFSGQTKLMGDFNLMNIGMAFEAITQFNHEWNKDFSYEKILHAIETCFNIPGRLEQIDGAPFNVIVDYAHTPDAFEKVLNTLGKYIKDRLIVVFGCAGERSKDRRFGLGRLAAEQANMSILTEEDSRSESIHDIVQDIENQMKESGAIEGDNYKIILDRKEAIKFALEYAAEDDFVLILGKGHEKSIESGSEIIPWDDREITKKLIEDLF